MRGSRKAHLRHSRGPGGPPAGRSLFMHSGLHQERKRLKDVYLGRMEACSRTRMYWYVFEGGNEKVLFFRYRANEWSFFYVLDRRVVEHHPLNVSHFCKQKCNAKVDLEGLSVFWCRKLLTLSKIEGDGSSVPVPTDCVCIFFSSSPSTISSLYCTFQRSNARIHLPSKMASLKWQTSRTATSTAPKLPITAIRDLSSGVGERFLKETIENPGLSAKFPVAQGLLDRLLSTKWKDFSS